MKKIQQEIGVRNDKNQTKPLLNEENFEIETLQNVQK